LIWQVKLFLDIGACCGESAWFFFKQGANRVICIEPNLKRATIIADNAKRLNWNCEIHAESFQPKHLN
jgi:FkbM family methyltransferase